jgi:hypothetical protein
MFVNKSIYLMGSFINEGAQFLLYLITEIFVCILGWGTVPYQGHKATK